MNFVLTLCSVFHPPGDCSVLGVSENVLSSRSAATSTPAADKTEVLL